MKRIKAINGYTIYEATSQRDADNYNCEIGSYNVYLSSDIRDFGLTNSYPEYDNLDSLTAALNICRDSKFAIACALADELSDSTVQDMDLCLEIERRFDAGESVEYVRDCYDPETGILHAEPSENPSYYTWLDSVRDQYIADCHAEDDALSDDELDGDLEDMFEEALSTGDRVDQNLDYDPEETELLCRAMRAAGLIYDGLDSSDGFIVFDDWNTCFRQSFESWPEVREWLEGVVFDDPDVSDAVERILHPEHFASQESSVDRDDLQDYLDRNYEDPNEVFYTSINLETGSLRQELIAGRASYDTIDEIENYGIWGMAVLELGYADIEVNVTHEGDHLVAEYFVCLKDSVGDWHSWGYIDRQVTIDWSAPDWRELLKQEMRLELRRYARGREWNIDAPMDSVIDGLYACPGQDSDDGPEPEPAPVVESKPRSHASYYVIETCDSDCPWLTCTVNRPADLSDDQYRKLFFRKVAERVAFADCGDESIDEIVFDGEPCHYTGWQPGMVIEFASDITGEIVYSGSFPEWDH